MALNTDTTRRAMLGGAGLAAALALAPVASSALPIHSDIECHWQARCAAFREFNADPETPDDTDLTDAYWARIDAAEIAILNSPDRSARAAELRLWVAWSHSDPSSYNGRDAGLFVEQADVSGLRAIYSQLDWHEKLIFSAILNLRGEG